MAYSKNTHLSPTSFLKQYSPVPHLINTFPNIVKISNKETMNGIHVQTKSSTYEQHTTSNNKKINQ